MSLGALDFGILVDGAVIVVEATLLLLAKRQSGSRPNAGREREDESCCGSREHDDAAGGVRSANYLARVRADPHVARGWRARPSNPWPPFMLALIGAFIFSFTFVPAMAALLVRAPKERGPIRSRN